MTVLTTQQRLEVWALLMRRAGGAPGNVTKPDLLAAVNAADDWVEANATASNGVSYNAALPQPYRGAASPVHKARLLAAIALKRSGDL